MSTVLRVPRSQVKERKATRLSRDISTTQYIATVATEKPKRFYVNQNKPLEQ